MKVFLSKLKLWFFVIFMLVFVSIPQWVILITLMAFSDLSLRIIRPKEQKRG